MSHFVYMLRCCDGSLYTGTAADVQQRLHAHNTLKSGAKYTRSRRPVELIYKEECADLSAARKREAEIKRMTREEKRSLVGLT
ncbi:GIY-YIG nuclease family protein [Candidatus Peregrinibacteria bacterium]|nr:MAG: GIY-YIG nuclease family protein [Candidatus Peregrinibacteria bacterium]